MNREFQYPLSHIRSRWNEIDFYWIRMVPRHIEMYGNRMRSKERTKKKFSVNRNNERKETLESN